MRSGHLWLLSLAALACGASGCYFVPKSRLEACQSEGKTFEEQAKAQLAEIENLKVHTRSVEDQLIRAEESLAALDRSRGAKGPRLVSAKGKRVAQGGSARGPAGIPAGLSSRLAELADRYPSLQYDAQTGISKLDSDVLFDSGDAKLKPEADEFLSEFAGLFQAPDAQDLKIMVVGHTDALGIKGRQVRQHYPNNWHLSAGRALAVADRLREAGIPETRMGVAGFGQHQPVSANDTADARQKNRRVEIFVIGPETPVVGWSEAASPLYR